MDVLIEASGRLASDRPDLVVAIAGSGRDAGRLEKLKDRLHAPVRMLGRVGDDDLPGLVGAADVSAMLCRTRWGGLEQEGFGIVFLEAAACWRAPGRWAFRRGGGSSSQRGDGTRGRPPG